MNKKTIAAFLGGIALTAAISTAAPVIKDAVTPKVDAAGTCPITLQPIQSTGNLVFSPFQFHSSDLVNLRSEINDLGAWADGEISALNTEVTNGKNSLRDKINSKKSGTLSTSSTPTFAQLVSAIDTIYTEAYNDGVDYQKEHATVQDVIVLTNMGQNNVYNESRTISHDGKLRVIWHVYDREAQGMVDFDNTYVRLNGTEFADSGSGTYSVSAGDTITVHQSDAQTTNPDNNGYVIAILYY